MLSPLSKFICAQCAARFKFIRPFLWYVFFCVLLLAYFALLVGALRLSNFSYPWVAYVLITVLMMGIYLPLDKSFESRFATRMR